MTQNPYYSVIFYRVVFFLAAITVRLFNRVLGADDAPFGPVMGKRGDAGAAAGTATTGTASSASGATIVAVSASATPPSGRGTRPRRAGPAAEIRRGSRW